MLSTLRIRRIGVIDDATLEFGPGFTALTGETGAGKTMIITGLTMLLGGRLDRGRTGDAATVAGTLTVAGHDQLAAAADELGADIEDGELLVVRRVAKDGRSRAHLGGVPVPISTLAEHVGTAVTVHGQSDQLRLREPDAQRAALDAHGGPAIARALETHRACWQEVAALRRRHRELEELIVERDRHGARLRDALERLDSVDPQPGEDETLRQDLERLANAADLRAATEQAALALADDEGRSAGALLDIAVGPLRTAAATDPALAPLLDRMLAAREELSELAGDLSRYADGIDASPARLDAAHQRLHDLTALVRDLGPLLPGPEGPSTSIDALLEASRTAALELDRYDGAEEEIGRVASELEAAVARLEEAADALSTARTATAERLARAVQDELVHLDMPQARIAVTVGPGTHREHGRDTVRIDLAPHPGAEPRPVAEAASGGELSRVMLALEVALASSRTDRVAAPVFVFDEIDAGIGGKAALAVGQRLARLAEHAQVIVVTHLPQVAAHAGTHLRIVKRTDGEHTSSTVQTLAERDRVQELARMLAGDDSSELALAHAQELLDGAHSVREGEQEAG